MRTLFVGSLGFLAACGLTPTVGARLHSGDSATLVATDSDGDGSPEGQDCDDGDASVNPAAAETCDGKDNDCNGAVDDTSDAVLYYRDADGDGWGAEGETLLTCAPPKGYAPTAGDCDDGDDTVHPETDDWCDGVDSDCDGTTDEDEVIWYPDGDGDGYGDETAGEVSCENPGGFLLVGGDCDDADSDVHPDATDGCDDFDDDCDGAVDEDATIVSWHYDLDGDGYGNSGFAIDACDQPYLGMTTDGTDCDDGDETIHPGAAETCDLADDDCDGSIDEGFATEPFYYDVDLDTWGGKAVEACTQPPDTIRKGSDCDDSDASIHPMANETCGDGIDSDCVGGDC